MGLHFIAEGATQGEPGVVATLQENPRNSRAVARSFSWSFDGAVEVLYRSPLDIQIDESIYALFDAVKRLGARRC
jgi:circadian clock protein KaiC